MQPRQLRSKVLLRSRLGQDNLQPCPPPSSLFRLSRSSTVTKTRSECRLLQYISIASVSQYAHATGISLPVRIPLPLLCAVWLFTPAFLTPNGLPYYLQNHILYPLGLYCRSCCSRGGSSLPLIKLSATEQPTYLPTCLHCGNNSFRICKHVNISIPISCFYAKAVNI